MWLEIWPVWFDFKPLVGNLTSGWKFHRGWLEFWPGALEYMVGNPTNLNHAKYKKILKPSLVQILKVKVLSFFRSRKWDFLQLRWGTRLSSTGLLLGPLMPEKKNLRLHGFQGFRTCGSYYTCGSQSFFPGESLFFSCSSFSGGASRCCRNGLHDVFRFSCTRVFLSSIAFIDHLFKTRLALSWKYHCTSYSILLPSTRWIEISPVKGGGGREDCILSNFLDNWMSIGPRHFFA